MSRLALAGAVLVALAFAACGGDTASSTGSDGELRVVASLGIFADFAREVGGDRVEVSALLPSGADPHTYEPTPSDIRRITEADVIFVNDLEPGVEGSILDVIQANKGGGTEVIPFLGDPDLAAAAGGNPHLWLDLTLARGYAGIIADALAHRDGANAALYQDNVKAYEQRLSQLDADIAAAIDRVPPERRKLVATHNAFLHFARRYGLEIVGFVVPGPDQDPSPGQVADLTQAIEQEGVQALFREPQIGPEGRLLEQIAADTGARVCTLYSDTLDDRAPTYMEMMRFNAGELARCLGEGDG